MVKHIFNCILAECKAVPWTFSDTGKLFTEDDFALTSNVTNSHAKIYTGSSSDFTSWFISPLLSLLPVRKPITMFSCSSLVLTSVSIYLKELSPNHFPLSSYCLTVVLWTPYSSQEWWESPRDHLVHVCTHGKIYTIPGAFSYSWHQFWMTRNPG